MLLHAQKFTCCRDCWARNGRLLPRKLEAPTAAMAALMSNSLHTEKMQMSVRCARRMLASPPLPTQGASHQPEPCRPHALACLRLSIVVEPPATPAQQQPLTCKECWPPAPG